MKATIENGELVIRIPVNQDNPPLSSSGKTKVVASTHGNILSDLVIKGKNVTIGLNAYISNK